MIAELKGCHLKTVQNYLVRYDIPRRSVHKYIKRPFSGDPLEKAYLIGFGVGDLCVHRANYSKTSKTVIAACTSTVPEQIELVRMLFEEYGGVNLSVGKQQTVITCYLDRSFNFLLEREDRIVDWITADQECFAAYLAGYIDAEGCIQLKRQTRAFEVVIRSYDVNILRTCWAALQKLGVVCPPVYLVKRQGERDGNGPLYHQDYWGLGIYRQLSLARLFELIAPHLKHPKRRQDMLMAWKNVEARMGRSNGG
ncbi:hypothetical protein TFLX_01011 [Thermoflexales bacterium]|nr:hypothetical protein TFLX_01011 [Thermoflexales bacterium]